MAHIFTKVTIAEISADQNLSKVVHENNFNLVNINFGGKSKAEAEELRLKRAEQTRQLQALEEANVCNLTDAQNTKRDLDEWKGRAERAEEASRCNLDDAQNAKRALEEQERRRSLKRDGTFASFAVRAMLRGDLRDFPGLNSEQCADLLVGQGRIADLLADEKLEFNLLFREPVLQFLLGGHFSSTGIALQFTAYLVPVSPFTLGTACKCVSLASLESTIKDPASPYIL